MRGGKSRDQSVSFVPVRRRRKRLHVARRRIPQREGLCELHNHEQPIARANERVLVLFASSSGSSSGTSASEAKIVFLRYGCFFEPKTRGGGSRLGSLAVNCYGKWKQSKMAITSVGMVRYGWLCIQEREKGSTYSNAIEGRHRRGTLTWHDVDRSGIFLSCGMDWRL